MALPPLAPARSASPDRGASPPTATPPDDRLSSLTALAPLRGSTSLEAAATGAAAAALSSAAARPSPLATGPVVRSTSGAVPGAGPPSPSPASSPSPSRRGSGGASPRVVSGPRKLTPAQLAERLHGQLTEVLRTEWKRIKSSNLGVLSGTAVVEELLLRRIQSWASELHMLAISSRGAADRLGPLCRAMDGTELQQLLVMFDQTGHPELSDFVRVMVFNTSDPAAKEVVGDLRALRAANSANRRARSTPSSSRRRAQGPPAPPPRFLAHVPDDPKVLRFSVLLPEGHRLVAGAHQAAERRQQQEDDERRAAEAREARVRARGAAGTSRFTYGIRLERRLSGDETAEASSRSSVLLGRSSQQELLPYFLADVEEQWRRTVATRIPAEGVYDSVIMLHESLPMYEAPPEAALMRLEAEEAAHAPPSRHGLATASVTSRTAPSFSGLHNRPSIWAGPVGSATATSALKRITSARPVSGSASAAHRSPGQQLLPGDPSQVAVGAEGSTGAGGSGASSSRFNVPGSAAGTGTRRGTRAVVLAPEGGAEGGSETSGGGGHGAAASGGGGGGGGSGLAAEGSRGGQRGPGSAAGSVHRPSVLAAAAVAAQSLPTPAPA